ncbi:MAG: hypothetical protein IJA86_06100 [Clostridia bacterium]|nr:hypothetical protein [Clostridia bacterium]
MNKIYPEELEAPNLDAVKPKIIEKLKEHIEHELPIKSKKKYSKTLNKILAATAAQICFGTSPSYEMGYVFGNVSAKAKDYYDGTTYYRTISVDLQTPEKPFFKNGDHSTCWAACEEISRLRKAAYTLVRGKYTWKIYRCNEEDEALNDYAAEVCGEEFRRIDYELTDTRVNDFTYVQTEPLKDCHFYPIYFSTTNNKGKECRICLGYYHADSDSINFDIKFDKTDIASLIIGGLIIGHIGAIIIALILLALDLITI